MAKAKSLRIKPGKYRLRFECVGSNPLSMGDQFGMRGYSYILRAPNHEIDSRLQAAAAHGIEYAFTVDQAGNNDWKVRRRAPPPSDCSVWPHIISARGFVPPQPRLCIVPTATLWRRLLVA